MRTAGAAAILSGACVATIAPPLVFHLWPVVMGTQGAARAAGAFAALSFAAIFSGVFAIQPPRGRRTLVAFASSLAATVICSVMGLVYTVLVGVILALAGANGYSVM